MLWEKKSQSHRGKGSASHGGSNKNEGSYHSNSTRFIKMDFPKFSGDDPREWLSQVAQYFEFQETLEERMVTLASFHLEGEANQWWQ